MKPLILTLLIAITICNTIDAQTTFAPAGSEWYHSMDVGVFHSYYASDTVIAGTPCRQIVRKAETQDPEYSMGLHVEDHATLYIYNTADTVFVYNTFFHRFTPLYVFNVSDGDTVRLPILPIDVDYLSFAMAGSVATTDSTFSFRVDSVRMKLYDTAMLKTVYTTPLGNPDSNYVYHYGDTLGAYAEHIGSIYWGLMPRGEPAVNLADESVQYETGLRCYNDPTMSIKLVSGICGIPPTQVTVLHTEPVSIFPNPAFEVLNITGIAPGINIHISITDMAGRVVTTQASNAANGVVSISVSALPTGIYILRLTDETGTMEYRKVSVQR